MPAVLLTHVAATLFMVGAIWIVQVVHYPLFALADPERFGVFAAEHQRLISWVVMPPMLLELATAAWLLLRPPAGVPRWALWLGATLLAVVWLSTFLLQVPRHSVLLQGFDPAEHRLLVATNWIRTAAWSARGALVLWLLGPLLRAP